MKRIFHLIIFLCAAWVSSVKAASVVTATLSITNAANISGTNGSTITVNADARAWTNSVASASTQILASTNSAIALARLVTHFSTYPVSGLTLASDGSSSLVWRGSAVTVTLNKTNWASVSYVTNTVGTAARVASGIRTNDLSSAAWSWLIGGTWISGLTTNQVDSTFYSLLSGGGGGGGSTAVTNTVWVSKNGDDGTGARGDLGKAFLTLSAAKTAAASGDTIFVMPGTYDDSDLLKDGVNWHFYSGAIVTNTSSSFALFDGNSAAITSSITGDGVFLDSGSFSVLSVENSGCVIDFRFRTCAGGNPCIGVGQGTVTLTGDTITTAAGNQALFIDDTSAVVTVNRARIVHTGSGANKAAVKFFAVNNGLTLRDCVLVSGASATNSINSASAVNVRVYGTLTANLTNGPNVTLITGSTRFEVDSDVQ